MHRKLVIYSVAVVLGIGAALAMSVAADKRERARIDVPGFGPGAACAIPDGGGCGMQAAGMAGTGGCGMHGRVSPDADPAALAGEVGCPMHKHMTPESGEPAQCDDVCPEADDCTEVCPHKAEDGSPTAETSVEKPSEPDTHLTT